MSLVMTWVSPDFAAVVSDGRCFTRDKEGNLVPAGEDVYKFSHLSPTIVLAGTGSLFVHERLVPIAKAFAEKGTSAFLKYDATQGGMIPRQDPVKEPNRLELFGELVAIIPEMARYVFGLAKKIFGNCADSAVRSRWNCEAGVMLVGYDAAQGRMRQVLFTSEEGFSPREMTDRFVLMGDATAEDLAGEAFISLNGEEMDPPVTSIVPNLERALSLAAQKCTNINDNLRSALILPPAKQI